MNDMASRPDDFLMEGAANAGAPSGETGAYLSLDPLLADLYKQYRDAQALYKSLKNRPGRRDPMTQVARGLFEGARGAFMSRLGELKRNDSLRVQVQASMRYNKKMNAHAVQEDRRRALAEQARARGEDSFFLMWFLMLMLQQAAWRARRDLHAAQAFAAAALAQDNRMCAAS